MKKQTLLLLTVSILAMSIATLFTACPKPEVEALPAPQKSGVASEPAEGEETGGRGTSNR